MGSQLWRFLVFWLKHWRRFDVVGQTPTVRVNLHSVVSLTALEALLHSMDIELDSINTFVVEFFIKAKQLAGGYCDDVLGCFYGASSH